MNSEDSNSNSFQLIELSRNKKQRYRVRKLQERWTTTQTRKLIEEVHSREGLWSAQDYRDRYMRVELWNEVAHEMGMTRSEVITKWNSVRGSYRAALIKQNTTKSSGKGNPPNEFFNSLKFLEPTMHVEKPPKKRKNSPVSDTETDDDSEFEAMLPTPSTSSVTASKQRRFTNEEKQSSQMLASCNKELPACSTSSDIWSVVGNFVASNGRQYAIDHPKLANEYKLALYKVFSDFQQRVTEEKKPCLYYALFSPPARACMITAKLIGLNLDLKLVDFAKKEHLSEEFIKLNPQHQIPVFVDDDGEVYIDSHAIMCFMVSKYSKDDSALYPKDLSRRARVDHRLHYENGVLFQVIKDIVARNIYGGEGEFNVKSLEMCHNAYGFLEAFLQGGDYVVGNEMSIADISINTTLITLDLLIPVKRERYPNICSWMERMKSLPDYDEVNVKGALALYTRITTVMSEHTIKTEC